MITRERQVLSSISHDEWLAVVASLVNQVEMWAREEDWSVHRYQKLIREDEGPDYEAPALRMRLPDGELHLNPIARNVFGRADGRVDLEAWPSHDRVRLILRNGEWDLIPDAMNKPLPDRLDKDTFVRLARELAKS